MKKTIQIGSIFIVFIVVLMLNISVTSNNQKQKFLLFSNAEADIIGGHKIPCYHDLTCNGSTFTVVDCSTCTPIVCSERSNSGKCTQAGTTR